MLPIDTISPINERIKDLRGKTPQADVAEYLGISRNSYRRLESVGTFSLEQISALAELFDVSTDFILNGEQASKNAFPIETPDNLQESRLFSTKVSIYKELRTENLKEELFNIFAELEEEDQLELIEIAKQKLEKK